MISLLIKSPKRLFLNRARCQRYITLRNRRNLLSINIMERLDLYDDTRFRGKIKKLEEILVEGIAENSKPSDIASFVKEAIKESGMLETKSESWSKLKFETQLDGALFWLAKDKQRLRPTYYSDSTYNSDQKADPNYFYYRKCHEMIIEHHQLKRELKKLKYQSDESSIPEENSETLALKKSGLLKRHRSGHNYIDTHSGKTYWPAVDEARCYTKGYGELDDEIRCEKRRLSRSDLKFNIDMLPFDLDSNGELLEADPNPPKKRKLLTMYKKGSHFTCTISPCNYLMVNTKRFSFFKLYYSRPIRAFETAEEFRNHVKQHHQESSRESWDDIKPGMSLVEYNPGTIAHNVFCDECPWSGTHESFLKSHKESTTHKKDYDKSSRKFECKLCEIKVGSKALLLKHNKSFHLI